MSAPSVGEVIAQVQAVPSERDGAELVQRSGIEPQLRAFLDALELARAIRSLPPEPPPGPPVP